MSDPQRVRDSEKVGAAAPPTDSAYTASGGLDVSAPRLHPQAAVVEQAIGVLMFRYGLGSDEALGVLARWAGIAHTDVPRLAHALMYGVCLGRTNIDDADARLTRWLVQQLRTDPVLHRTTP